MKKLTLNFASILTITSLAFAPTIALSQDFTYNGNTKINETNNDVVGNQLNGNVIMTAGKLELYDGFSVTGTIDSNISGRNEISFEGDYTLQGNIGGNNHFLLTALQNQALVDVNGHEFNVEQFYLNGGVVNGDVIAHEGGFIDGVAGSINGKIDGASAGVGAVHFVKRSDGGQYHANAGEGVLKGDIGQTNKLDDVRLDNVLGGHTVSLGGYNVNADRLNIESGTVLNTGAANEESSKAINANIIIAGSENDAGVLNIGNYYSIGGSIEGENDGDGIVNTQGFVAIIGGDMGNSAKSLKQVNVGNEESGSSLEFYGNNSLDAEAIKIAGDSRILIGGGTINGAIDGFSADSRGTLAVHGDANILGTIGQTNALELIEVGNAGNFTINNSVNADVIEVNGGTLDFSDNSHAVSANITSVTSSFYNFGSGDHSVDGNLLTAIGDELSFKVNHTSQGSLTTTGEMHIANSNGNSSKLKLDISGLNRSAITTGENGTTYTLMSGGENSALAAVEDSYITVGQGYSNNNVKNVYGELSFNTVLDGNNLLLTFSDNESVYVVEEGENAFPDLNIDVASIIIESGSTLNMRAVSTSATNIIVFGTLNTGANNFDGFISGYSSGTGVVNIAGLDATFTSNGNIGYVHRLSDVNILAGNTLDLSVNDNFIDAANINVGNNATLRTGAGDVTGNIILGENSTLNVGEGRINGSIDGILPLEGESPLFSGKLLLRSDNTISHNIGENAPIATVEIADSTEGDFQTIDISATITAIDFKIGDDAVVNLSDATITAATTLGDESIINIGENVTINGNITQTDNTEGGTINISANFTSNGDFTGVNGAMNLLNGADLNAANGTNVINGYDVVLSNNSSLTFSRGNSNANIDGDEDGHGELIAAGNSEISGRIGETHALKEVRINDSSDLTISGGYVAATDTIYVPSFGSLTLSQDTTVVGDVEVRENSTFDIQENSHNINGALSLLEDSFLAVNVSSSNGVISHGRITASDNLAIHSQTSLSISVSPQISATGSDLLIENLSGLAENINQIADENIYINAKRTNSIGNFLFKTEVVDGSLKLNITHLTQALNIYAADGDDYNYSQGNPNENDVATSIREVTEVNLMDSGATLSMGSGALTRKVNLAEGSVLNTGSGDIVEEIVAMNGSYQGTVNIKENLSLAANMGAADRELRKISIQNGSLVELNDNDILAQEIEIISGNLEISDIAGSIAAEGIIEDSQITRTNIILGGGDPDNEIVGGTLTINMPNTSGVFNNSIHANVVGMEDGVGRVVISNNISSNNLSIGTKVVNEDNAVVVSKIGSLEIEGSADVFLREGIYSLNIQVGDGDNSSSLTTIGSIEANQIEIARDSILSVGGDDLIDASMKIAAPVDGDENTASYGINIGEGAQLITHGSIYKNYTQEDIFENSKITLENNAVLQTYGTETVLAATIDGNESGKGFLKIGDESIGDNETAIATTSYLYGSIGEENALEEIIVGIDANLIANPNAAEYPDAINISAQTITLKRNSELTVSGRLSAGLNDDEDGYNNANINLYNDSVLTLNSGAEIFGEVNGVHDGEEEQSEAVGRGTVAFANSAQPTSFALSAHIGDTTRIGSISVGQNVEVQATSVGVYTQSLSLGQNSNFLSGILHSSNVTIDTNNIERGLIATDLDYTVLNMTSSATSSLTITSGKVTGVGNYLLGFNTNANASTTITVGQNSLEENDSAAILSNTASGKNIIHLTNAESIELNVENKATGTISTNGGTVFNLAQGENADSTFTLTNAGTITKSSGEASAVVSNYATTINNSGTITGAITLNPSQRAATITNSGTINGDIEISSSDAYNPGSNSGGSSITMEEGGVVNGNITMNNDGTRVVGNGGRINGNFTMNNADQSIYFNGLTLNGDILGVSSIVTVQSATFVKESTIIETESFDTFSDSSISLTLSSPSPTASLQIIGAANLSSSTTLNLTISGDIADDEYYTLISATEGLSGADIDDELIIINNGQNRYNGKAFSVSVIENQLRLIGVDIVIPEIETPFSGARDVFNNIVNDESVNGNLAIIQDILTSNNTSNATKEETLKSILPQVDNSINRNSFNLINSSVSVATGRIDGLRNGVASGDEAVNKRMWGEVFGNSTAQKGTASNNGYDLNSSGFAMGGDKEISRDNYVGASASYADSSSKGRGVAKSIQAKTYQFNLYNAQTFDKFFLDSVVGFAWNEYNSNRSIAAINSNARANFSGQGYIAKIRTGSVIDLPASFTLAPELAITAAHNRVDSYTEKGAANANLQVRSSSANFFETRAGFALSHRSTLMKNVVIPQFRLSYGHDFAGARQHATANFVGQSTTFQSQGDAIVRGSTKIGLGLKVYTKGTTTINADYDVELKSGYRADAGVLRLTHGF